MNGVPGKQMSEDAQNADRIIGTGKKETKARHASVSKWNMKKSNRQIAERMIAESPTQIARETGLSRVRIYQIFYSYCERMLSPTKYEKAIRSDNKIKSMVEYLSGQNCIRVYAVKWNDNKPRHIGIKTKEGKIIYFLEHRLIAEKALGKKLPKAAVVHHVNGIRNDNNGQNLVVCENQSYHILLHTRERRLKRLAGI